MIEKDYVFVINGKDKAMAGVVFVEARIKDDIRDEADFSKIKEDLETHFSPTDRNLVFELWKDILTDEYFSNRLPKHIFHSLKPVEYLGPKSDIMCYSSKDVRVRVQVYRMHYDLEVNEAFPQGEILFLPHIRLDGRWEDLVFDEDLKGDLIWIMTNMLRFSQKPGQFETGEMNRLILLHGPTGSGKSSLCQGLAQKISIRLNSTYKDAKLVTIKTATLLSKFFSESARQVDEIFTAIERICDEDMEQFICVLIDEVESIAGSRTTSTMRGEAQDSLRATNALLTGFDRIKCKSNLIVLCTSNMPDSLDPAFLDRCGLSIAVHPPSLASQYTILRDGAQKLINRGVILSKATIPIYRDVPRLRVIDPTNPGSKLYSIVELINVINAEIPSTNHISGRALKQLPEKALLRYLRGEDCDLDWALKLIEHCVKAEQRRGRKRKLEEA